MKHAAFGAVLALLGAAACQTSRPVWSATPADKTAAGTIAGILTTPGGEPVAARRVEAIALDSSQRYSAVTNVSGGFSIEVPPGKYRLQPELREGETVVRDPGVVDINKSDLDANREIVIRP
jgi:Carboxypeptidase regulatory-like domain